MDAEIASEFQNLIFRKTVKMYERQVFRMDETVPSRLQNLIVG